MEFIKSADLRAIAPSQSVAYVTETGSIYRGFTSAAPGAYVHDGARVIVPTGGNGSAAWLLVTAGESQARSHRSLVEFYDDFLGDAVDARWNSRVGSDPQTVAAAITASPRGVVRLVTGDDAGATMALNGVQLEAATNWRPSDGGVVFEASVRISAITNICVFFGLTDQAAALEMPFTLAALDVLTANATDAVGFLFDTGAATDTIWLCGVAADVAGTHQNIGVAFVAATFQTLRIEVDAIGTAKFYIAGRLVGTMAAAVTATVGFTPVIAAFSRGTAVRNVDADFIYLSSARPLV
jgi:hypothetical protein